MPKEVEAVKTAMYKRFVLDKEEPIYDTCMLQKLCVSAGATQLFDTILRSITTPRHSQKRIELNKKRAVAMIYKLCYSKSQFCNSLQIDHGLYLKQSHLSQDAFETEYTMGTTCSRHTLRNLVAGFQQSHRDSLDTVIKQAIEHQWLIVLIIDDYTNIHTKRRPTDPDVCKAANMCSIIIKVFKNIKAIPVDSAINMHDPLGIDIPTCTSIITSPENMHRISQTYSNTMPSWITTAFFNPESERQRIYIHQYSDSDHVRTMRKMEDLYLVDFVELSLKSHEDFAAAYDVVFSTSLKDYMEKFVVLQPGDWPCQFYCRQIVYKCLQKYTASNPPLYCDPCYNLDHTYSYPHHGTVLSSSSQSDTSAQPSLLSILPTIGPLHISLNSREHIVTTFHPF